jgi:hypothetical protein
MKKILLYTSGILILFWGITHFPPTAITVRDFGDITFNNKLIITMEWIVEGLTLIFIGILIIVVTRIETESKLARAVYFLITGMLFSLAILSIFTRFRIDFLPFKLCPVIFSASAVLILVAMKLKTKS